MHHKYVFTAIAQLLSTSVFFMYAAAVVDAHCKTLSFFTISSYCQDVFLQIGILVDEI